MSYCHFSTTLRTAHKQHICIWCGQKILIGEKYDDERSVYDGQIQRHRWHLECSKGSIEHFRNGHEEEFDPWEMKRGLAEHISE